MRGRRLLLSKCTWLPFQPATQALMAVLLADGSPPCLQFSIAGDRVVMRPNAAYTPKVVVTPFRNQVIELAVFSPPPFASAEEESLNKLCPVRALRCYAECTRALRQSDQLFVCFGARAKGRLLSKPSLSRWIVE